MTNLRKPGKREADHDRVASPTRLSREGYEVSELEFTAGAQALAELADDHEGEVAVWASAWVARAGDIVETVARRARVRYVGDAATASLGLTRAELDDARYVCGIGALYLALNEAPVQTHGFAELERVTDIRRVVNHALARNAARRACRDQVGRELDVEEAEAAYLRYVDGLSFGPAGRPSFESVLEELTSEDEVVLNVGRVYAVGEDEDPREAAVAPRQPAAGAEASADGTARGAERPDAAIDGPDDPVPSESEGLVDQRDARVADNGHEPHGDREPVGSASRPRGHGRDAARGEAGPHVQQVSDHEAAPSDETPDTPEAPCDADFVDLPDLPVVFAGRPIRDIGSFPPED